jgi:hypothetical protein
VSVWCSKLFWTLRDRDKQLEGIAKRFAKVAFGRSISDQVTRRRLARCRETEQVTDTRLESYHSTAFIANSIRYHGRLATRRIPASRQPPVVPRCPLLAEPNMLTRNSSFVLCCSMKRPPAHHAMVNVMGKPRGQTMSQKIRNSVTGLKSGL